MHGAASQQFHIRRYCEEDFAALHALDQQCFTPEIAYSQRELRYFLEAKDSLTLVAEDTCTSGRAIVGFVLALMYRARPTFQGRLITIDVAPGARRQKLGSILLTACEEEMRLRLVHRFRLEVAGGNLAAQALYHSHGYGYVTKLARYYPTGEDAFVMQKQL